MSNFADHGNAFRADGETMDYGTPPKFTAQNIDHVGRLAYEMKREAISMAIHANRLEQMIANPFAEEARAQANEELRESMDACQGAIDAAIAYLTRHERRAA